MSMPEKKRSFSPEPIKTTYVNEKGEDWLYTRVPHVIDDVAGLLSTSESALLRYICRRTIGQNRKHDRISLDVLQHGMRKRDGRQYDFGTGMSRNTILRARTQLVDRGFLRVVDAKGGPTLYSIDVHAIEAYYQERCAAAALLARSRDDVLISEIGRRGVPKLNTQKKHETKEKESNETTDQAEALRALAAEGVANAVALKLVEDKPTDLIMRQIAALPNRRVGRSREGMLVKSIQENWSIPGDKVGTRKGERAEMVRVQQRQEEARVTSLVQKLRSFWSQLRECEPSLQEAIRVMASMQVHATRNSRSATARSRQQARFEETPENIIRCLLHCRSDEGVASRAKALVTAEEWTAVTQALARFAKEDVKAA